MARPVSAPHLATVWALATAILLTCWFTGDARATATTDPLGLPDLPSRTFTLTYATIMTVAASTTMIATWKALQRNDLRPRLRRAARALCAAAACTIGLATTLTLNALVLHLPLTTVELLEQIWWIPAFLSIAVAGL